MLAFPPALALAGSRSEYGEKARWLLVFGHFTNWREVDFPTKDSPFVLGILGENPFRGELDILKQKPPRNRKVEIKLFKSADEVADCQMLFIPAAEARHVRTLKPLIDHHILTISDAKDFLEQGGIARIEWKQRGPTEFDIFPEINEASARRGGWDFNDRIWTLIKSQQDDFK